MKELGKEKIKILFIEHYNEWCLRAYSYLGTMDEAEDVVQGIFVKILDRQKKDEIIDLKKYIDTAVRNASFKSIKQSKRWRIIAQDTSDYLPSFEDCLIDIESRAIVLKAVERLPEQGKKALNLCVIQGLSYKNAADVMGISINTVKYHLKNSFKILRVNLRNMYLMILIICYFVFF